MLLASNVYAFDIPPADGFVTDVAGVLSASQEQALEINLQNYKGETSNEIGIFIINSLEGEAISELAVEVGREWGVGSKENDNGILLLIAIEDRELFIATGYGLEGAVPDLAAKQIIDDEIVPQFKGGDYNAGIEAGIFALKQQIGGEYEGKGVLQELNLEYDLPWPFAIIIFAVGFFIFFAFFQFFVGILVTLSPSRSWWEGVFLGGMFGFFFAGLGGMLSLALLGGITDFFASLIFAKSKRYQKFIKKQKKNMKNKKGMWFIGGGRGGRGGRGGGGSGGGGGGFSGGSFGGGGAGGSW